MKINNKKLLDSNMYSRIIIRKHSFYGKYINSINVSGKMCGGNIVGTPFSNDLKGLSDNEQIMAIIQYFLRNNLVYSLSPIDYLKEYKEKFILVHGINRLLGLCVEQDQELNSAIPKLLFNKMNQDRINAITTNDIDTYEFETSNSSYYTLDRQIGGCKMKFGLLIDQHGCLIYNDQKFFERFIRDKLSQMTNTLDINYIRSDNGFFDYGELYLNNSQIIFRDTYLSRIARRLIDEHNQEIKNYKFKQLKMEGF